MKSLFSRLREPIVEAVDVDTTDRLAVHRSVLLKKPMLRGVFSEFHELFRRLDNQFLSAEGSRIELGAGVAPIRDTFPDVLATDIVDHQTLDQSLDAQNMTLGDESVRVLYGQNCFHHFPQPQLFFKEAQRVLAPGGGIILLEPYHGPLAKYIYKNLFDTEGFDKQFPTWETPVSGPMNGANQALSYIVFERDRTLFESRFPDLKITHQEACRNHLKYLLSGGLNFRQLVPDWSIPAVEFLQRISLPLNRWTALHHVVVIRKS